MKKLKAMFNGLWCYRYLLWNLVSRDFKLKYRRSVRSEEHTSELQSRE